MCMLVSAVGRVATVSVSRCAGRAAGLSMCNIVYTEKMETNFFSSRMLIILILVIK